MYVLSSSGKNRHTEYGKSTYLGSGSPPASHSNENGLGWLPFDATWYKISFLSCCLIIYGGNADVRWTSESKTMQKCNFAVWIL